MGIKEQILRSLREFYPIKVDENVLVSAVQKNNKDEPIDQIYEGIRSLVEEGRIEVSAVKAPYGKTKINRFRITGSGIEHLRSLGGGSDNLSADLARIESQLVENYDQLRADIENVRRDMEKSKAELDGSLEGACRRISDLSEELMAVKEVISTYARKAADENIREEQLILRILTGAEKEVYDTILNAGGEMFQKDLVARTKMSNAKVSRVVDRLEDRGILAKERHGATNRLRVVAKQAQT